MRCSSAVCYKGSCETELASSWFLVFFSVLCFHLLERRAHRLDRLFFFCFVCGQCGVSLQELREEHPSFPFPGGVSLEQ